MNLIDWLSSAKKSREEVEESKMIPEPCYRVQCGIYSSICLTEIDMRKQTWNVGPIKDSHYLNFVECIERYPRVVLNLKLSGLFSKTQILDTRAFSGEGIQIVANGFAYGLAYGLAYG